MTTPQTSGPERAPDTAARGKTSAVGSEPTGSGPEQAVEDPPGVEVPVHTVQASTDQRLQRLHADYPDLKAQADSAGKALKDCTDAIKSAVTSLDPEQRRFALVGDGAPVLRVTYSESWRFDSKRMKADATAMLPEESLVHIAAQLGLEVEQLQKAAALLFVRYSHKVGSWSLRPGGGS